MDKKNTELNSSFMGAKVHPNAFVDPRAELHDGVIISQGAIVGPNVTIGSRNEIGPNAVIKGKTQIGCNNKIFPKDCSFSLESTMLNSENLSCLETN